MGRQGGLADRLVRFVFLFVGYASRPFSKAGRPADQLAQIFQSTLSEIIFQPQICSLDFVEIRAICGRLPKVRLISDGVYLQPTENDAFW